MAKEKTGSQPVADVAAETVAPLGRDAANSPQSVPAAGGDRPDGSVGRTSDGYGL